jgi:ankyrin repeat protein
VTVGGLIERISSGRCDLVIDHLESGGSPEAADARGVPLIKWCAYYGDLSALRLLVAAGAPLAGLGDNLDLNGAAFHGHWQLCEYLIEAGADPNRALPNGETPLHSAITKAGRPQTRLVVEVLLAAGADPNAPTLPHAETGCFMRDARTRGETPLHRAAAFAEEQVVRRLLDAGASPSLRDACGDSPLSWASWHLRPAAIIRLLCFDGFSIHPEADWTGDHGAGASALESHLQGSPLGPTPNR